MWARRVQLGSRSAPTLVNHLLCAGERQSDGKLGVGARGVEGSDLEKRWKGWNPEVLLLLGPHVCVCVHACACVCVCVPLCACAHMRVFTRMTAGSMVGSAWSSPRPLVSPPAHRAPLTASLPGPPAQSASPSWRGFRYCSPASSSIRILLHSCESFSKQTVRGREGRAAEGRGGRGGSAQLVGNPAPPPPSCLLPLHTPTMYTWGPQSSGVSLVSCAMDLLCDLLQGTCLLWVVGENGPEGPI